MLSAPGIHGRKHIDIADFLFVASTARASRERASRAFYRSSRVLEARCQSPRGGKKLLTARHPSPQTVLIFTVALLSAAPPTASDRLFQPLLPTRDPSHWMTHISHAIRMATPEIAMMTSECVERIRKRGAHLALDRVVCGTAR